MGQNDAELTARLRVQVDEWTRGFEQATQGISSFTSGILNMLGPEGVAVAAVVGFATVVGESLNRATNEYAKFELSIDSLSRKVEMSGASWGQVKDGLLGYLDTIEETTRFSKEDAAEAMDKLMQRTNNYSASLRLLNQAMNLSAFAHIPLTEAANMLGLAYEGNQRGLLQLGRTLGMTSQESKNAQNVFDELARRTDGLAVSEDNLSKTIAKTGNTWHDVALIVGQAFGPAVTAVNNFLANVFHGTLWAIIGLFQNMATLVIGTTLQLANLGRAFYDITMHHWSDLKIVWNNVKNDAKATVDQLVADWGGHEKAKTAATETESRKRVIVAAHAADLLKGLVKSELQYYEQANREHLSLFGALTHSLTAMHKEYVQGKEETDDAYKERVKADQAEIKKEIESVYKNIQDMAKGLSQAISASTDQWVKNFMDGTATMLDFFKDIAQSILKYALKAVGQALVEEGAGYMARATAALLSGFGAAAAPGMFAAGAELSAVGGVIEGLADTIKLASGGIVTQPIMAMIGEGAGPEAVIPLDHPSAASMLAGTGAGGGLQVGNVSIIIPGITRMQDLGSQRFAETTGRQFATTAMRAARRVGSKPGWRT